MGGGMTTLTDRSEQIMLKDLLAIDTSGFPHESVYVGLIGDKTPDLENASSYDGEGVLGGGYVRKPLGPVTYQQLSGDFVGTNDDNIIFSPSGEPWSVYGVALYDSSDIQTGNKLAYYFNPESGGTVDVGESFVLQSGSLSVGVGGAVTDLAEDALLKNLLADGGGVGHTSTEAALFRSDPGESGSTTSEVSSGIGYSRQTISWTIVGQEADRLVARNDTPLDFGTATADWGTVTHLGVMSPGGGMLYSEPLGSSDTVNSGQNFTLNANTITLSIG